jgi:hypothetical protein
MTDYFDDYNDAYAKDYSGTSSRPTMSNAGAALEDLFKKLKDRKPKALPDYNRLQAATGGFDYSSFAPVGRVSQASPQPFTPSGPPERYSVNILGDAVSGLAGTAAGEAFLGTPGAQRGGVMSVNTGFGSFGLATAPVNFQNFATYAREAPLSVITSMLGHNYQQPVGNDPYAQPAGPVNTQDFLQNMSEGDFGGVLDNIIDGVGAVGETIAAPFTFVVDRFREANAIDRGRSIRTIMAGGNALDPWHTVQFATSLFDQSRFQWQGVLAKAQEKGVDPLYMLADLWDMSPDTVKAIAANPQMTDEQLDALVKHEPFSYDPGVNTLVELGVNLAPIVAGAGLVRGTGFVAEGIAGGARLLGGGATTAARAAVGAERIEALAKGWQSLGELGLMSRPIATAEYLKAWSLPRAWRAVKMAEAANRYSLMAGTGIRFGEWAIKQAYEIQGNDAAVAMMDQWLWEMPLSNNPGLMLLDGFAVHPLRTAKAVTRGARDAVAVRLFGGDDMGVSPAVAKSLGSIAEMPLDTVQERLLDKLGWDGAAIHRLFGEDGLMSLTDLKNGLLYVAQQVVRDRHESKLRFLEPEAGVVARNEAFWKAYGTEAVNVLKAALTGRGKDAEAVVNAIRTEFWTRAKIIDGSELGAEGYIGEYDGTTALSGFAGWVRASKAAKNVVEDAVVGVRPDVNREFTTAYREHIRETYKDPSALVSQADLNALKQQVPGVVKYRKGLLKRKGDRVPKVTRRQLEGILDSAEADQAMRDLDAARPETTKVPALKPHEAENQMAIAKAFKLRQDTVQKLMETPPEELAGAVPGDLAKVLKDVYGMTESDVRRSPETAWPRAVEWWNRMYPSAVERGQAIDSVERFGKIVTDRAAPTREGALDQDALRRIRDSLDHPYAEEEKRSTVAGAIADERNTALTEFVDQVTTWLDDPARKLHVEQLGDVATLEANGYTAGDGLMIESLAREAITKADNAEDAATLADPTAHPLEKAPAVIRAGVGNPVQQARLGELGSLEGTYESIVKDVLGEESMATRETVQQVTDQAVGSQADLVRLREVMRSLAGSIDRSPTRQYTAEVREFIDRAQALGTRKVGVGPAGATVESWRAMPLDAAGITKANADAVRADIGAVLGQRLAARRGALAQLDAEYRRITGRADGAVAPDEVSWGEPIERFPTKKAARAAAEVARADGEIYGVAKVGSRWGLFKGELVDRPAPSEAAQPAAAAAETPATAPAAEPTTPAFRPAPEYHDKAEYVPIDVLKQFVEIDRRVTPKFRANEPGAVIDELANDIKANGLKEPLILEYDPATHTALLTEGNHRIVAAEALGMTEVPVRVTVAQHRTRPEFAGAEKLQPQFQPVRGIEPNADGYIPADLRPSDILDAPAVTQEAPMKPVPGQVALPETAAEAPATPETPWPKGYGVNVNAETFRPQEFEAIAQGAADDAPRLRSGYSWEQVPIERLDRVPDLELAKLYERVVWAAKAADDSVPAFKSKVVKVKGHAAYTSEVTGREPMEIAAKPDHYTFKTDDLNNADQNSLPMGDERSGKFATSEQAKAAMGRWQEERVAAHRERIAQAKHDLPYLEAERARRGDLPLNKDGQLIRYAGSIEDAENGYPRARYDARTLTDEQLAFRTGTHTAGRDPEVQAIYQAEIARRASGEPSPSVIREDVQPIVEQITEAQRVREAQVEQLRREATAQEAALAERTAQYQGRRLANELAGNIEANAAAARYAVSNEGMAKGYWKIVDTTTGNTVKSGRQSKAATADEAARMNAREEPPAAAERQAISATEISAFEDVLTKSAAYAEGEAKKFRATDAQKELAKLERQRALTGESAATDLTPEEVVADLEALGPKPSNPTAKREWQDDYDRLKRIRELDLAIEKARDRVATYKDDTKAAAWYSRFTVVEGMRHAIETGRWDAQLVAALARMDGGALSAVLDRVIADQPNVTIGDVAPWFNQHFDEFVGAKEPTAAPARLPESNGEVTFLDPADNKTPIQSRVVLVDANDLLTSDEAGFPPNLQPRSRGVRASSAEQVQQYASDIQPDKLIGTTEGAQGMPVVSPDGAVVAGNGRTMALRQADTKQYGRYRTRIQAEALKYGFTVDDVNAMGRPMLVRELVNVDAPTMERLAWQLNEMPIGDLAPSVAGALTRADIRGFVVGDGQSLADAVRAPSNAGAVARMIGRLPRDWQSRFHDPKTGLNEQGAKLLEAALISKLLRADDRGAPGFESARSVVFAMTEQGGEEIKRIGNGLAEATAQVLKSYERAESGAIPGDILTFGDDLAPALARIIELRGSGLTWEGVQNALDNTTAFDSLTPIQSHLAKILAQSKTQKDVRTFVRAVARAADEGPVQGQEAMFADVPQVDYTGLLNEGVRAYNEVNPDRHVDYFPSTDPPYDVPLGTAVTESPIGQTQGPARMTQPLAPEEVQAEVARRTIGEPVREVPDDPHEAALMDAVDRDPEGVRAEYDNLADTFRSGDAQFQQDFYDGLLEAANDGTITPGQWMVLRALSKTGRGEPLIRRNKAGAYNMKMTQTALVEGELMMLPLRERMTRPIEATVRDVTDAAEEDVLPDTGPANAANREAAKAAQHIILKEVPPETHVGAFWDETRPGLIVPSRTVPGENHHMTFAPGTTPEAMAARARAYLAGEDVPEFEYKGAIPTARVIRPQTQLPISAEELAADVGPDVPHTVRSPAVEEAIASGDHTLVVGDNPSVNRAVREATGAPRVDDPLRRVYEVFAPDAKVMAERVEGARQAAQAEIDALENQIERLPETDVSAAMPERSSVFPDDATRELWDRLMRGSDVDPLAAAIGSVEPHSLAEVMDAVESIDRGVYADPETGVGLTADEAMQLRTHLMRLANGSLDSALGRAGKARESRFTQKLGKPVDDFDADSLAERAALVQDELGQYIKTEGVPITEGFLGAQYVLSKPPSKGVDAGPLSPRLLFTDRFAGDVVPGLLDELSTGRMEDFPRRVSNSRLARTIDVIAGPRPEKAIRAQAIGRFTAAIESYADLDLMDEADIAKIDKTVRAAMDKWQTAQAEHKFAGFSTVRRVNLLGPEVLNKLFDDAVGEVYGKESVPNWYVDMQAEGTTPFNLWRRADNRIRAAILKSTDNQLSRAIEYLYGKGADLGESPGRHITVAYHFARFLMDIRWLALEKIEPAMIAIPRGGLGSSLEASWTGRRPKIMGVTDALGLTKSTSEPLAFGPDVQATMLREYAHWANMADLEQGTPVRIRYLIRELAREQPRPFREVVKSMMREEPGLRRIVQEADGGNVDAFLNRLDRDWQLMERGTKEFATAGEAAHFFRRWKDMGVIDDVTYNEFVKARKYSAHPAIEAELASVANDPVMTATLERLAAVNQDLFHNLTATFFGQENRSNIQRALNHPFLFWPISYQIKATKWLMRLMLEELGGVDTGAAPAGVFQHVWDEHRKRWTTDERYRAKFNANKTAYFLAGMLFPIIPTDIGVSMSPWTRMIVNPGYERPYGVMGVGPIYTNLSLIPRLVAEQTKPGMSLAGLPDEAKSLLQRSFPQSITIGGPKKPTSTIEAEQQSLTPRAPVPVPYEDPTRYP